MRKNTTPIPDVLNSRTEKVILELPNYAYCHSSSSEDKTHSFFLGRKALIERLKSLIISASSNTGVYLVTGNRGVGKSSLVNEVIEKTSLNKKENTQNFTFLFVVLLLVIGIEFITSYIKENKEELWNFISTWGYGLMIVCALILFFVTGYQSYQRQRRKECQEDTKWAIWSTFIAACKEFFLLPNKSNPFLRINNVLKLIFVLLVFEIITIPLKDITNLQFFIVYLFAIVGYHFYLNYMDVLVKEYRENNDNNKRFIKSAIQDYNDVWIAFIVFISISIASGVLVMSGKILFGIFQFSTMFLCLFLLNLHDLKSIKEKFQIVLHITFVIQINSIFTHITNYINNCSRVYLKINFGHDVLRERDILRLITRTLTTEYNNFFRSWKHRLYWRILALTIIVAFTIFFYNRIYKKDFRPLIENTNWYQQSSQLPYIHDTIFEKSRFYQDNFKNDNIKSAKAQFLVKYLAKEINTTNMPINYKKSYQIKTEEQILHQSDSTIINNIRIDINNDIRENKIGKILLSIDRGVNRIYHYIHIAPEYFWTNDKQVLNKDHKPVNYALLFIFLMIYLLGELLLRSRLFTTHYTIQKQLKLLNESITHIVEREISAHGGDSKVGIGIKKKKSRFVSDEHEIEKELQDILNNIQKIPVFMTRPEFVIVFDELDKVSPQISEKEMLIKEGETKKTLFAANSTSERQAVILKLLSNLKYFLSSANAKFLFIAGREMYDMYLADIADRNNYFGSIFNDVIFVPSLLADMSMNKRQYDITTLVEEYICRHLIPENLFINEEWNLKYYRRYLETVIYCDVYKKDKQQAEQKVNKIIATLQQFIIYLSHTSKGAPKTMIQVFEGFIKDFHPYGDEPDNRKLVVKQFRNTHFFLVFDYYDQFTIGMTSYLVSPVIYYLSDSNIQEHSDKLLVSSLHFVDYMLKFYNQNFSWRNLDISPEVLEPNRSPELKSIINDIMTLYEQIHLDKPIISLFEFKFDAVLAQEIFFISSMEESFSAQFNFSLDESLAMKHYYGELLRRKQLEHKDSQKYGKEYVSSIASLQVVLGDLYFLDDELEEAALYYKDSAHLLQKALEKDKEKHENLELFYLFVRNQLKLAYLYEKRKQTEFAYLLYGEIVKLLIEVRNFDLDDMGINIRRKGNELILVKRLSGYEKDTKYQKYAEIPKYPQKNDGNVIYNEMENAKARPMYFKELTPATQSLMFKNMTFEGLQLLYLPLLVKLQILEKRNLVGIIENDIQVIEDEFNFLIRTIPFSEIKILTADFYSKVGDILYYKNKLFSSKARNSENQPDNKYTVAVSHHACKYYKKAFIGLICDGKNNAVEKFEKMSLLKILKYEDKQISIAEFIQRKTSAKYCAIMARVLSNIGDVYFAATKTQCNSCKFYNEGKDCNSIKIGDDFNSKFWNNWYEFIESDDTNSLKEFVLKMKSLNNIEFALFLYSLSSKFFKRANQHKHSAFQMTKILSCFKYYLKTSGQMNEVKSFLNKISDKEENTQLRMLTEKILRSLYIAYEGLNIFEILKRKEDFDLFDKDEISSRDVPLHYIQVDSEISRIRIIAKELELLLVNSTEEKVGKLIELYGKYITSPYHIHYGVSARVHRLRLKEIMNWGVYKIMKEDIVNYQHNLTHMKESKKGNGYVDVLLILTKPHLWRWNYCNIRRIFENKIDFSKYKDPFVVLEMLIADSIFCLNEILDLIKTAGDSYLFTHDFFASIYNDLASWTVIYEAIKHIKNYDQANTNQPKELISAIQNLELESKIESIRNDLSRNMQIDKYLEQFIGKDFKEQVSCYYYRLQALSHFHKSIETHNGGRAYFNLLEQMYFIRGDYDDMSSHFNISADRFLINNAKYDERILKLKKLSEQSRLYDIENYFNK